MTFVILGIRIRNAFHSSLHPVRRDQWGETEINLIKFVEIETTVLWRSSLFGDLFADYSEPSKHEVTMLRWIHVSYSKRRGRVRPAQRYLELYWRVLSVHEVNIIPSSPSEEATETRLSKSNEKQQRGRGEWRDLNNSQIGCQHTNLLQFPEFPAVAWSYPISSVSSRTPHSLCPCTLVGSYFMALSHSCVKRRSI